MPNDPQLTYNIAWKTCRNKPLIQKEVKRLLFKLFSEIGDANGLLVEDRGVLDEGRVVWITVRTTNAELSPNSIAYLFRHKTGGEIRRSNPEFQKLPAIWTSEYEIYTIGR